MRIRGFRYALSSCVAAALLTACGGSQPPIGMPGAMPQDATISSRGNTSRIAVRHMEVPTLKEFVILDKELGSPFFLIFDTEGNLWFNAYLSPYLGKMTPAGRISAHPMPKKRNCCGAEWAYNFALGPDHDIWFTDYYGETLGTIEPGGKISQHYPVGKTGYSYTAGIATLDKHLWVVMAFGYLIEANVNWDAIKEITLPGYYCWPGPIAIGQNKTLWIGGSANCPEVMRVTTDGTVTDFPVQAKDGVWQIAAGPDGNMWFTAADGPKINAWIGKITPDGQITKYPIKDQADGIALGPDGNWWITEPYVGHLISMNLQGQVVDDIKLPDARNGSQPLFQAVGIIEGPDGNMWFGEGQRNKIGELVFSQEQRRGEGGGAKP